jgi:hypothetical protein
VILHQILDLTYNDYDGVQHDYTRKGALAYEAVMLPPQAPDEWKDREKPESVKLESHNRHFS